MEKDQDMKYKIPVILQCLQAALTTRRILFWGQISVLQWHAKAKEDRR